MISVSKKLLVSGVILLGMHNATQAYDASILCCQTTQMLNFAQTLRQVNSKQALNVAQWIELQACDTYNVQDRDILAIATVINNPDLTIQLKITVLSQIITQQKNTSVKSTIQDIIETTAAVAVLGAFYTLAALVLLAEIKNPTPRPTVTVSYRISPRQPNCYHPWPFNW